MPKRGLLVYIARLSIVNIDALFLRIEEISMIELIWRMECRLLRELLLRAPSICLVD